jgi:hypothetical protein
VVGEVGVEIFMIRREVVEGVMPKRRKDSAIWRGVIRLSSDDGEGEIEVVMCKKREVSGPYKGGSESIWATTRREGRTHIIVGAQ